MDDKIHEFCSKLEKIWRKWPELRFGQMMVNMLSDYIAKNERDVFFVEDEDLLAFFEKYMNTNSPWRRE